MSKPSNGVPDANEFGKMRSYLAQNGFPQAWISSVIGVGAQGRTRSEITQLLKDALALLPKA